MAATTGGAIKAHLEAAGLGLAVYRDRAPQDAVLPYLTVQEGISYTPVSTGDRYDDDADKIVDEQAQVSLWQPWRDADGRPAENYTLPGRVYRALDGKALPQHPKAVSGMTVAMQTRIPAIDEAGSSQGEPADGANVVHDAFTVTIRRKV